jgi:hypothetical protein
MSTLGTTPISTDRRALPRSLFFAQIALLAVVIAVAVGPLIIDGRWPGTAVEWVSTVAPTAAALIAVTIFLVGRANGVVQRRRLVESYDTLRAALRKGAAGDEALRVSTERRKFGARRLTHIVERGRVVDEKLRAAVASGVVNDEKLRLSVAAGVEGAEALRVSVAQGIQGAEELRVSIANGIDAASTTLAVVDTVDAAITLYAPDGHILLTNDTARTLAVLAQSGDLDPLEFADDRVTPHSPVRPGAGQGRARAARHPTGLLGGNGRRPTGHHVDLAIRAAGIR